MDSKYVDVFRIRIVGTKKELGMTTLQTIPVLVGKPKSSEGKISFHCGRPIHANDTKTQPRQTVVSH